MPYRGGSPLRRVVEARLDRECVDQVANAPDSTADLTPASEAPAEAVRAGFAAWLPGLTPPLIWERTFDAEPCDDR